MRDFLKKKNNNLLVPLFSALFLSSCSNGDMSDIENSAFKCTKYVSSEKKLPEHIKNPITFVFSNKTLNYSKSIPFYEVFKKKGEKNFGYDSSSSVSFGFNYWGDLEIRLEDEEGVKLSPIQHQGKEIIRGGSSRSRELEYHIFRASTKKDNYKGKWTLSEDIFEAVTSYSIGLKGTLKCTLIENS